MWIKINNGKSEFALPEKILDYNMALNITSREVNTARQILTLHADGHKITCKPRKNDYSEWLKMLKLSGQAIHATAPGY